MAGSPSNSNPTEAIDRLAGVILRAVGLLENPYLLASGLQNAGPQGSRIPVARPKPATAKRARPRPKRPTQPTQATRSLLAANALRLGQRAAGRVAVVGGITRGAAAGAQMGAVAGPAGIAAGVAAGAAASAARSITGPFLGVVRRITGAVAPLAVASAAVNSNTSGFVVLNKSVQVFGAVLGTLLLPVTVTLATAVITAATYLDKELTPALEDWYDVIKDGMDAIRTAGAAFSTLRKDVEDVAAGFKKVNSAIADILNISIPGGATKDAVGDAAGKVAQFDPIFRFRQRVLEERDRQPVQVGGRDGWKGQGGPKPQDEPADKPGTFVEQRKKMRADVARDVEGQPEAPVWPPDGKRTPFPEPFIGQAQPRGGVMERVREIVKEDGKPAGPPVAGQLDAKQGAKPDTPLSALRSVLAELKTLQGGQGGTSSLVDAYRNAQQAAFESPFQKKMQELFAKAIGVLERLEQKAGKGGGLQ